MSGQRGWIRTLSALGLAGALVLGAAAPAFADPVDPTVPDSGSRPNPGTGAPGVPGGPGAGGQPGNPGGGTSSPVTNPPNVDPPAMGPLASRITAEQQAVELLGERVKDAESRVADLKKLLDSTRRAADAADEAVERAEGRAENTAEEAYREYAGVPEELRDFAPGLEHLAPGLRDSSTVEGKGAADSYAAALELAEAAHDALESAEDAVRTAEADLAKLRKEFEDRSAALAKLRAQNADALKKAQDAADRYADKLKYDPGSAVNGLLPHPKALKAVRYALAQRGKPYVWGDEGPDTFDCSGLVWAAYRYAGVNMQARTARQQYYSTPVVAAGHLLPGDLVFFGPDKTNPESIHHVGIYIGKGKIVHAPTAGDVVKVSPIWWWEYFAATRVVPAVKAPGKQKPKPDPTTSPKPSPKPNPSWSTSPKPTPSSPKPSSPKPSSPKPSTSSKPAPNPSQSAGGTPCPSPSPSRSPSGSPSPSPTPSASPSGSASPDPCATRTAAADREAEAEDATATDHGAYWGYAWILLGPSEKAAMVAGRRRTRAGSRQSGPRRRRTA